MLHFKNMGVYCLPRILILVSALSSVALSEEENSMVYSVNRRLNGDVYNTIITLSNSTGHFVCSDDGMGNLTFLVSERRCVNNEEFFNGELDMPKVNDFTTTVTSDCNFTITATEEESSIHRIALIINYQNDTEMIVAATPLNFDTFNLTDAVVYHRPTGQPVRSAFCHISSLEMYRGRNKANKISHDGFHLNQRGAIEVRYIANG